MSERSVEEVVQEAEATTVEAHDLMEKIARQEIRNELRGRGLHEERLSDQELDVFAEGIAELPK